jgi:hypothetical protein
MLSVSMVFAYDTIVLIKIAAPTLMEGLCSMHYAIKVHNIDNN